VRVAVSGRKFIFPERPSSNDNPWNRPQVWEKEYNVLERGDRNMPNLSRKEDRTAPEVINRHYLNPDLEKRLISKLAKDKPSFRSS